MANRPFNSVHNLRTSVWQANLSLWRNNLVFGTQGNVSGLDRNRREILIKPSGVAYETLTPAMLVRVRLNGQVVSSKWKPSVDTIHHLFLYRHLKEVGGVCHTHSRFTTVFAILGQSVPTLSTGHADVFGTEIPVTEYVDNSADAIGQAFLSVYRKTHCPAIILGRHGLFAVGTTAEKAAFHALMAEYCAQTSFYALLLGSLVKKEIHPLPEEEIRKWFTRYHSERYGQDKTQEE
ncbi:MAG: class II aldolase/adducin family protein [Candidatus Omnitrophica bacterium]|nr:class II aldolase/adducin family protein [Candidatus Omnitrophota bacterium]